MNNYELTFLISPILSEQEIKETGKKVEDFILSKEGKIQKKSEILKKNLGYPIKKCKEAFLATFYFGLSPEKIENLEKEIKSDNNVIRYIILSKKNTYLESSAFQIMRPRRKKITPKTEEKPSEHKKVELGELDKEIEEILKE